MKKIFKSLFRVGIALALQLCVCPIFFSPPATAKPDLKPGEPLIRTFCELFQDKQRDTRLEAYFLSVGLPERAEHTQILRRNLVNAEPLERVVILYALAAMTRNPQDIDAFLDAFPQSPLLFTDLVNAEWYLCATFNSGLADFLLLLVYEPRTKDKALPHLARIIYNCNRSQGIDKV